VGGGGSGHSWPVTTGARAASWCASCECTHVPPHATDTLHAHPPHALCAPGLGARGRRAGARTAAGVRARGRAAHSAAAPPHPAGPAPSRAHLMRRPARCSSAAVAVGCCGLQARGACDRPLVCAPAHRGGTHREQALHGLVRQGVCLVWRASVRLEHCAPALEVRCRTQRVLRWQLRVLVPPQAQQLEHAAAAAAAAAGGA
jgi:hypothetical protein